MTKAEREVARKRRARRRTLLSAMGFGAADAVLLGVLGALGGWGSVLLAGIAPVLLVEAGAVLLRPGLRSAGWLPRWTPVAGAQEPRAMLPAYLRADPGDGEVAAELALPAAYADGRLVVDLGAAEPIVWRRRRFLRGFDMAEDVPLRPPYRVIGTGPAIGAGAALVDSLVYRQLDLEVAGAGVALAVPEEALGFVRAALAAVGRAAGEKAVAD